MEWPLVELYLFLVPRDFIRLFAWDSSVVVIILHLGYRSRFLGVYIHS